MERRASPTLDDLDDRDREHDVDALMTNYYQARNEEEETIYALLIAKGYHQRYDSFADRADELAWAMWLRQAIAHATSLEENLFCRLTTYLTAR